MTCPVCNSEANRVLKSLDSGSCTQRRRACACGVRWTTEERVIAGSISGHKPPESNPPPLTVGSISGQETAQSGQETGENGKRTGNISSDPVLFPTVLDPDPDPSPKGSQRAKSARVSLYSQLFSQCWRVYGRKQEKAAAYAQWVAQSKLVGGEGALCVMILAHLQWQGPLWAVEAWSYAPYFERYLKRRKWEDEPPPGRIVPRATPGVVDAIGAWMNSKGDSNDHRPG